MTSGYLICKYRGILLDYTTKAIKVASNAKAASQIINVNTNATEQQFPGITWKVPDNVNVNSHINKLEDSKPS